MTMISWSEVLRRYLAVYLSEFLSPRQLLSKVESFCRTLEENYPLSEGLTIFTRTSIYAFMIVST